jgi:hypothetical protein
VLVRFSSTATESITMFGDSAIQLIKMLGASGAIPGAIGADDIPQAIQRLRQALQAYAAQTAVPADADLPEDGDRDGEPRVGLATRAAPLLGLLERAGVANVPLMWEVA